MPFVFSSSLVPFVHCSNLRVFVAANAQQAESQQERDDWLAAIQSTTAELLNVVAPSPARPLASPALAAGSTMTAALITAYKVAANRYCADCGAPGACLSHELCSMVMKVYADVIVCVFVCVFVVCQTLIGLCSITVLWYASAAAASTDTWAHTCRKSARSLWISATMCR